MEEKVDPSWSHKPVVPLKRTKSVTFGLWNPDTLSKYSTCAVTSVDMYVDNEPQFSSLFDLRMGTCDQQYLCKTCGLGMTHCVGHFGRLNLARPCYYWHFMPIVLKILQTVCHRCFEPLCDRKQTQRLMTLPPVARFQRLIKLCSSKRICSHCDTEHPKIVRDNFQCFQKTGRKKEDRIIFSIEKIVHILDNLSDRTIRLMGFDPEHSHPSSLICRVMAVAPPAIRPSMLHDASMRSEGDLTFAMLEIIKANKNLQVRLSDPEIRPDVKDAYYRLLQYHVTTMIDNRISGIPPAQQRSGRNLRSIRQKLKGKDGRIRGNTMGKRTDFSSRTVISPDPSIDIDELGVPMRIAMRQTEPEVVNDRNRPMIEEWLRNGPSRHPGANVVEMKRDEKVIMKNLSFLSEEQRVALCQKLENGDIVHRHLLNGDHVAFNRQPSLHKMSMMGHRVRVLPYSTFRISSSVCTPYNADFDGDEMNMFNPQSIMTRYEVKSLMHVPRQIISPQGNKPVIGCIMDTLVSSRKMTLDQTMIPRQQVCNIINAIHAADPACTLFHSGLWKHWNTLSRKPWFSGKEVFSLFLPFFSTKKTGNLIGDPVFEMKRGQVVSGFSGKAILGAVSGGLVQWTWNDFGPERTRIFLKNIQNAVRVFSMTYGVSVGIGDCIIPQPETHEYVKEEIQNACREVNKLLAEERLNKSVTRPWFSLLSKRSNNRNEIETQISNLLNSARDNSGSRACEQLEESNTPKSMAGAQSKGSAINIGQITCLVGQQNVQGLESDKIARVPFGLQDRTLVHFHKFDHSPDARGFVRNSYLSGLNPDEFFFHAMSGREGIIDTAVKTSETGYIQRRLMKHMEDVVVHHDQTVRNSAGSIVHFVYGNDGFDASFLEKYNLSRASGGFEYLNRLWDEIGMTTIEVLSPIPITRILDYLEPDACDMAKPTCDMAKPMKRKRIEELLTSLTVLPMAHLHPRVQQMNDYALLFLRTFLAHHLDQAALSSQQLDEAISLIKTYFFRAVVNAGEMVGPIAAQSIGEPATQLTLNTFHGAGISSKSNVTRGVPRVKELINVSKTLKTPSLTIPLLPGATEAERHLLARLLPQTTLGEGIIESSIHYQPDVHASIEEDRKWVSSWLKRSLLPVPEVSPWMLRLRIDPGILFRLRIDVSNLLNRVMYGSQLQPMWIINSQPTDSEFVLQIRYLKSKKNVVDFTTMRKTERYLFHFLIHGVERISKTFLRFKDQHIIDTNGANLRDILCMYPEGVTAFIDRTNTISNDITEVAQVLGIEAARAALLNEFRFVMESNGITVNPRHFKILVDVMSSNGYLLAIDRHGIKKSDQSPFARASFEESADQLARAAVFSETDDMTGVSSNIIMGQPGYFGTMFQTELLLDWSKLPGDGNGEDNDSDDLPSTMKSLRIDTSNTHHLDDVKMDDMHASPQYAPASPQYAPSSPNYPPASPNYPPASPNYPPVSPTGPRFTPYSPTYDGMSPRYAPSSPVYDYD